MSYIDFSAIILAAGRGNRMLSDIPKVLHQIGGKFMLQHLIDSVIKVGVKSIYVVYGYKGEMIKKKINADQYKIPVYWILQNELIGTGDAVRRVLPIFGDREEILVLYGDVPFVSYQTLRQLHAIKSQCDISMLTATLPNPKGYGRIIRNQEGNVVDIIEHNDIINDDHNKIKEVNTGIFIAISGHLKHWLSALTAHKLNNEFYLTDIVKIAHQSGYIIHTMCPADLFEIMGVNSKLDLVDLDKQYQQRKIQCFLLSGLMIADPNRFNLRGNLVHGKDVYIDINVIIEGHVSLGNRVKIGASCILKDTVVEDDVEIYPFSIIENTKISLQSKVGPFVRLRPGTELKKKSHVGNFVEIKNTQLGEKSKVKHLSYLGDANIGDQVNIGAGTIICNYDSIKKHHTIIGDDVFIGADSQLIAPITIGKNATIGAGTTVTRDVPPGETIISRIRQFSILNWKKRSKK
ncbi:bifunctional UDP-N-acetylglucosamine diphosphorylase/glucosamine-1-phosphate N-acetyltransferase GlmU [Blochmannia endosymbiont of Camponotus sp. C-003]|uniref:bifunctional UDP-N-acetylglucosamine diphosphorylase/glucosamine-1-phosphate N-acetyltransferase GlmU n=1 Tax=unclassified Candidatus Blochmanniella TaxID=711328 RepID=UPI002024D712|nr:MULTISPECIES: bifunctional UDP-N-acetylglucosamine diphosphorylase/glucosamine-1-phosphate N-acetyltransferase GlmU [unclassified Candidatus Blochmannia]URJ23215.1 bifunctional UDP-N-acetylglucosamine diphosphorylase/glucosamine-1-phosphate N-acetyltransferase GlmU [Blochmannia endosymbiont of Camponotus sp. C-003]URJ28684.1 bifunctional UDP-N-acetylglucosamine diphosphorylase/glucosamine-1-phosphate N-acetyltransferase GlmU [Blochmannia endosymbiont of Camponotus sp. C-046]